MAVTWDVGQLDATTTVGSLSDVITCVHWTASDSDGDHTGYAYGEVGLAEADGSSFTAYASVTKENAIAWAKAALGSDQVANIEASIAAQITESKTPTTTSGVPW
tara:strand:+ start:1546 stop:1860 length:315 start_codon:yes stop_codon:yes gene_type:complete